MENSLAGGITAIGWLDYRRKLTAQDPWAKYRVVYNASGTNLSAVMIKKESIEFEINGQSISAGDFL